MTSDYRLAITEYFIIPEMVVVVVEWNGTSISKTVNSKLQNTTYTEKKGRGMKKIIIQLLFPLSVVFFFSFMVVKFLVRM